jgi:hypothetical protein
VGAFRGFGGLFLEPPKVSSSGGGLFVESAGGQWILCADAFGATFHRATEAEAATAEPFRKRTASGLSDPSFGELTSVAEIDFTRAFAFEKSHAILLVPTATHA